MIIKMLGVQNAVSRHVLSFPMYPTASLHVALKYCMLRARGHVYNVNVF